MTLRKNENFNFGRTLMYIVKVFQYYYNTVFMKLFCDILSYLQIRKIKTNISHKLYLKNKKNYNRPFSATFTATCDSFLIFFFIKISLYKPLIIIILRLTSTLSIYQYAFPVEYFVMYEICRKGYNLFLNCKKIRQKDSKF